MFDIDALVDEEAKTPYTFRAAGGKWRVPHAGDLKLGQQIALDTGRIVPVLREVAERWDAEASEWVSDGAALAEVMLGYKARRVGQFQAAWLTQAGMEPGEPKGSSAS